MGSEESHKSMESSRRFNRASQPLLFILSLIVSNTLTAYLFCCDHDHHHPTQLFAFPMADHALQQPSSSTEELLLQLNQTQSQLFRTQEELSYIRGELQQSRLELTNIFLDAVSRNMEVINASSEVMKAVIESKESTRDAGEADPWLQWSNWLKGDEDAKGKEIQEFTALRALPLGWNAAQSSDTMISSIGHACALEDEDLKKFMDYEIGGECPDDQNLAQRLLLHGCEPLPRRRCFARIPPNFTEPDPIPDSLWTIPSDNSILWSAYTCKSFECLNARKKHKVFDDCNDCFDLSGPEKYRWVRHGSELDFSIDEVLETKNNTIRIGLDIGGGSASFAVRMRERDITIVTTSMNLNGPFNNFIALRGVVPLYITVGQRFPFFDNTLDIVHSMHVLSHWIPTESLQFLLFDIDRVLRPGGLFWLDRFFCGESQLEELYIPMIRKLRYKTLKWAIGNKLDRGRKEVYLSAVLEKPMSRFRLTK